MTTKNKRITENDKCNEIVQEKDYNIILEKIEKLFEYYENSIEAIKGLLIDGEWGINESTKMITEERNKIKELNNDKEQVLKSRKEKNSALFFSMRDKYIQ